MYAPVVRVEQVRPGEVAEPVAQRDQPAHRSDVARGERHVRVAWRAASTRRGRGSGRASRSRRSSARSASRLAQQLDLDLLAGVVALDVGRDDQQPVGANQRGRARRRRAAAARRRASRRRARAAPGPSRPSRSSRRACARAGPGATGRGVADTPSSSASSGAAKMSNVSDADTGYPGAPSTGVDVDRAEHDRMAGAHGDAVHGQLPELIDERGGVVVASGARAGDDDQQVAPLAPRSGSRRRCAPRRRARSAAPRPRSPASRAWPASISELVSSSSPGASVAADRAHLVAGRQDRHDRLAVHADLGGARGARPPPRRPAAVGGRPAAAARWR